MDPGLRCHGMKDNPTGYLWLKYERLLVSSCQSMDYCDGNENMNADDRADYNSDMHFMQSSLLWINDQRHLL